ncbi:MAG TPA: AsmA-like C-terminal domain-containing protein [Rhizomicrobium sp.]|nr:AsmA-like C-terminal domain-containing protein [Rhizomicrobium sp.]
MNLRVLGAYGRSASLILRRIVWGAVAVAAAVAFFCLGLLFRVLMGPVSLGPFSDELRGALNQVLPGFDVRFDTAALEWDRSEGRINLVILGTRVLDHGQRIIAQAPKAEIGLAAGPFLHGRIAIKRIALVGVQLTLVHSRTGSLRLGLQAGNGGNDILQQIRDAISHGKGHGTSLQSFAVREARLAFYDEETGAFVVAPRADLQVSGPRGASGNGLDASLAAEIEVSGKPARLFANIRFPFRGDLSSGDVSISGLSLPALARDGQKFGFLSPLRLTADVTGSWTLAHGTQLRFADFGIGATGYVEGLGHPLHVKSLRLVGRYDGQTGKLLIDDATLAGEEARAHLTGSASINVDPAGNLKTAFGFTLDRLGIDVPDAMEPGLRLGRATLIGSYDSANRSIVLERAALAGGPLSATLAGRIVLAPNRSPELDLDGRVDPIAMRDLLPYWPIHLIPGARGWIAANIQGGRLGPALIHARIQAGAFGRPFIPDNAVLITFPVQGAAINYLPGLTPLTGASGSGTLTGDNFKADLSSASIGPLSVTNGHVTIANLHVHGTPALIKAHVSGALPQFFALLDMKPLQYPTRFHVNTSTARGDAAFDAVFRVPTIKGESIDSVGISVNGAVNGLGIALGPHTRISDGTVAIAVDNTKLHAAGKVILGATPLDVDWLELFKPQGPVSTTVDVHGILDDAARADLGLPSGSWLTGPVGATAHLLGYRARIQTADIDLDLTEAVLSSDLLRWRKPAGTPETAHIAAQLGEDGSFRNANLNAEGSSLTASATVAFAADGSLSSISAPSVRAGVDNDFAVVFRKQANGSKEIDISGHSLDASGLLKQNPGAAASKSSAAPSAEPFHLTANLDRLVFRPGVAFAPFSADVTGIGRHPVTVSAKAGLTTTSSLTVRMASSGGQRHLTATADDAGAVIGALLDTTSVKGGTLSLDATLPPVAVENQKNTGAADTTGELIIRNCTVLNQPFFTRVVSSGSPSGMADLLRGQGIVLDSVHIPFRVNGDVVSIHDARATGPSVGFTADGYIDRATNQIALSGAMAPIYGLNGLLGVIPILGNVFVSKKGEGLFGITYTLHGDLDHPLVSTNPLSVLAPGILRRIFEGAPTDPAASARPAPPKGQ